MSPEAAPRRAEAKGSRRRKKTFALPRDRAPFSIDLRSWAGFAYRPAARRGAKAEPASQGRVTVAWEYDSDEAPSRAHDAAYEFFRENEPRVTSAILSAIVTARARGSGALLPVVRDAGGLAPILAEVVGPPRVYLLEQERDGFAYLGFLVPCAWATGRDVEVVVHKTDVTKVGALDVPAARGRELEALDRSIGAAMMAGDLRGAAERATLYAGRCRGTRWYPVRRPDDPSLPPDPSLLPILTPSKLSHDVDQLRFLEGRGVLDGEIAPMIREYEYVLGSVLPHGAGARLAMDDDARARIGHVYKRIVHVRSSPRVARALSTEWSAGQVENSYLAREPNLVVVDRFLTDEAIESLRQFCLESTIWSTNRYGHGRLGSFFRDGFNSPLLIQIAEELREAMPRVIGARHPLRQLWGFKCESSQPRLPAHADFAAVNVNFWITPDHANLDPESGGMLVHDVKAPPEWDFDTYNRDGERIEALLSARGARTTYIPYRCNRAILFDSDLFHTTSAVRFAEGYENRRINVTLLFGDRNR